MEQVVAIDSTQTVSQAIEKMIQTGAWSLLVERQELPVGVITDRDILRRCVAVGRFPGKVKVEEIMSAPIITIEPEVRAGEALRIMIDKDVRRLYVVERGKVIGRVTHTGLSKSLLDVLIALNDVRQQL
jgi:CBS domain-containing protein